MFMNVENDSLTFGGGANPALMLDDELLTGLRCVQVDNWLFSCKKMYCAHLTLP